MSLLTATMIGAAFFGADPEVVSSGPAFTQVTGRARFISVDYTAEDSAPAASEVPMAPPEQPAQSDYSAAAPVACEPTYYGNAAYCQPRERCWRPWCDCHDDDCEDGRCDRHIQTYCIGPGDFYPHYPYMPVHHGYYYFRPYNYIHVEEASALAGQMGGDPKAPYSVEFLRKYFPPAPIESPVVPSENQYPMLEDLLEPKMPLE